MTQTAAGPVTIAADTLVLPTGLDPAEHPYEWPNFAVHVRWQNDLGWTVTGAHADERLTVKTRKWTWHVAKRNRRHYYFDTFEEALEAAVAVVDERTVSGRTWAQWTEVWASRGR